MAKQPLSQAWIRPGVGAHYVSLPVWVLRCRKAEGLSPPAHCVPSSGHKVVLIWTEQCRVQESPVRGAEGEEAPAGGAGPGGARAGGVKGSRAQPRTSAGFRVRDGLSHHPTAGAVRTLRVSRSLWRKTLS